MVLDERTDWMLREYNQQMRVRPSNISFEDWKVMKGYIVKQDKTKRNK